MANGCLRAAGQMRWGRPARGASLPFVRGVCPDIVDLRPRLKKRALGGVRARRPRGGAQVPSSGIRVELHSDSFEFEYACEVLSLCGASTHFKIAPRNPAQSVGIASCQD